MQTTHPNESLYAQQRPPATKVPLAELRQRMTRFHSKMDELCPEWELCALVGEMNVFYLTGTIVDGVLFLRRNGPATLWVRRGYERAVLESEFEDIRRMSSFRDVAAVVGQLPDTLYLDMSFASLEWYSFLTRYMPFRETRPVDKVCLEARAVKSDYELTRLREAGATIDQMLFETVPPLLHAGMSEADLGVELFSLFIKHGYHGLSRFTMRNTPVIMGHIGFGISALYPSVFDGASGTFGLCPAAPVLGSRHVTLKKGDLVYIDVCFGIDGYNVDKTLIYSYGAPQPDWVCDIHELCLSLEREIASMLLPGTRPCDIYEHILARVPPEILPFFMGPPGRTVPFLGHGVGLYVDEYPVLAKGFVKPLEAGMTLAVEPKAGLENIGMVGNENTYLVTPEGGDCLSVAAHSILVC